MGQDLNLRAAERPLAFEASALNRAPPPIHNPAKKEEEAGESRIDVVNVRRLNLIQHNRPEP